MTMLSQTKTSGVNQTRFLVQNESFKCIRALNESVYNSKQKLNHDECWCECKELDDLHSYKDDYTWNSIAYDFEFNKACKLDEYLDIKNCSCKKCLIGKLVLACEDEILVTTETSYDDKKATCEKK